MGVDAFAEIITEKHWRNNKQLLSQKQLRCDIIKEKSE